MNRAQQPEIIRGENGALGYANPEIRLQLHLLFVANFKDHDDSIKNISSVISFFQSNNVFSPKKHPELDENIKKSSLTPFTIVITNYLTHPHRLRRKFGVDFNFGHLSM